MDHTHDNDLALFSSLLEEEVGIEEGYSTQLVSSSQSQIFPQSTGLVDESTFSQLSQHSQNESIPKRIPSLSYNDYLSQQSTLSATLNLSKSRSQSSTSILSSAGSFSVITKATERSGGLLSQNLRATPVAPEVILNDEDKRDKHSGFRLQQRFTATAVVASKLRDCSVVPMKDIHRAQHIGDKNWVVFGIIAHKSETRESAKGGKYCIFQLSDLKGNQVPLFVFGKAFEEHWKLETRTVISIANAKLLQSSEGYVAQTKSTSNFSLSISSGGQILSIGISSDMAYCKGYKVDPETHQRSMQRCKNIVDTSVCQYCQYHAKSEYNKMTSKRMDLNRNSMPSHLRPVAQSTKPTLSSSLYRVNGEHLSADSNPVKKAVSVSGNSKKLAEAVTAAALKSRNFRRLEDAQKKLLQQRLNGTKPTLTSILAAKQPPPSREITKTHQNIPLSDRSNLRTSFPIPPTPTPTTTPQPRPVAKPKPLPKPTSLSVKDKKLAANQARALAIVQACNGIPAPDPNSTIVTVSGTNSTTKKRSNALTKIILEEDGAVHIETKKLRLNDEESKSNDEVPGSEASSEFTALFGKVDVNSERGQQLLKATALNAKLLDQVDNKDRDEYWDMLDKKESLGNKLASMTVQTIEGWFCTFPSCGKKSEYYLTYCQSKGHTVVKRPMKKRYFECACAQRTITLDALIPVHSCPKCGAASWKSCGAVSTKSTIAPSVRSELKHREEEVFSLRLTN